VDSERLAQAFVALADSLVDDFDAIDLLHGLVNRCVDVLGAGAAGLLLLDAQDRLQVAAYSSGSARMLDLYQLQNDEGPCLECYSTGQPVVELRLDAADSRWPRFAVAAASEGFTAVLAVPMRLRSRVIGALNLFGHTSGSLAEPPVTAVAQAMADVATITLLQERLVRQRDLVTDQLQSALNSRIVIEQAKGVLATRLDLGMDEAFEVLRHRARENRRRLTELAEEVVRTRPDGDWSQYRPPAHP
jgi:GAF domain-containing protein